MVFSPEKNNIAEKKKSIKEQANYQGDWTLLLRERLLDLISKGKFIKMKQEEIEEIQNFLNEENSEQEKELFSKKMINIQKEMKDYDSVVQKVFSSTKIGNPNGPKDFDLKKDRSSGGRSFGWKDKGRVENYKIKDERQKNITEAHEKIHGVAIYFTIKGVEDIFDEEEMSMTLNNAYDEVSYDAGVKLEKEINNQNEILASMSSLKNYFGMRASDIFSEEHLKYALDNYCKDMEGVSDFTNILLNLLKRKNNSKFLEIINSYPI